MEIVQYTGLELVMLHTDLVLKGLEVGGVSDGCQMWKFLIWTWCG